MKLAQIALFSLLLTPPLFAVAQGSAQPTVINLSEELAQSHCARRIEAELSETLREALNTTGGMIRVDTMDSIGRVLRKNGATPKDAGNVQEIYELVMDGELSIPALRGLRRWNRAVKSMTIGVPASERILVGVFSEACSACAKAQNHVTKLTTDQFMILTPGLAAGQSSVNFIINTLGTLQMAAAAGHFEEWLFANIRLSAGAETDKNFQKCVTLQPFHDGKIGIQYSKAFLRIYQKLQGETLSEALFALSAGDNTVIAENRLALSTKGFQSLDALDPGARSVRLELGLLTPEDYFDVADKLFTSMEETIQKAQRLK